VSQPLPVTTSIPISQNDPVSVPTLRTITTTKGPQISTIQSGFGDNWPNPLLTGQGRFPFLFMINVQLGFWFDYMSQVPF
jgi:hypothetical protein